MHLTLNLHVHAITKVHVGACCNLKCMWGTGGESILVARRPRDGGKTVGMTVERLPLRVRLMVSGG